MPVSSNTFTTTLAVGNREELSDIVDITQRSETPIYSMIGNVKAESIKPEWETISIDAPGLNIQSEGRDYTFTTASPAVRFNNYTQILQKDGKFSGSQAAANNAGNAESPEQALIRKGVALRTDVEYSLVSATPSLGGTDRQSGALSTWATTNVTRGAGGANGGFNQTTKVTAAPTNGTQRAFTKTLLDDLLQAGFTSGAKLEHMFVSPYIKRVFATFMSDANVAAFRYAVKDDGKPTAMANVEVYQGPLGRVYVHEDYVMAASAALARNVFVLDTKKIKWAWFRKIAEDKDLAKTGDYEKFVLQGEGCVKPLNEKAVGVIADVFGLTATT